MLSQENCGASVAKNKGLAKASGEYFAIVDSDDILLPDALSTLYEAINSADADIVHGGYVSRNQKTGRRKSHMRDRKVLTTPYTLEAILTKAVHHDPWAKLFRRSLFTDHHILWPESIRYATDFLIVHKAFYFARRVLVIPDLVYEKTNIRPGSLTNCYLEKLFVNDRIQARSDVAEFIRSQGVWEQHKKNVSRNNEQFFEQMIVRQMIRHAKGACFSSMKDNVHICKSDLPEFTYSDGEIARTIIRFLNKSAVSIASYSSLEKEQIIRYVEDYLLELNLDQIDLTEKERQFVQTFSTTFNNRINRNKLFSVPHRYYNIDRWKVALQWLLKRVN